MPFYINSASYSDESLLADVGTGISRAFVAPSGNDTTTEKLYSSQNFLYGGTDVSFLSRNTPTQYLTDYVNQAYSGNGILKYIYSKLFGEFTPDISGYTLLFMVPPHLSGYEESGNSNYTSNDSSFMWDTSKFIPLLATNFTPPQIQMNSGILTGTSGTQHYATELSISDNMSITFVETKNLDIYSFHRTWLNYIYEVLEGNLSPSESYIESRQVDYMSSAYFVKFRPDMEYITYIGKAIGCFPKGLPSSELLGTRTQNDMTTLSFDYTVSDYREMTFYESSNDSHWLIQELSALIFSRYGGITNSNSSVMGSVGVGYGDIANVAKRIFSSDINQVKKSVGNVINGKFNF